MPSATLYSLAALCALIPAAIASMRSERRRDGTFWLLLGVAVAGPLAWAWVQFSGGWRTGFAPALWATVVATLCVFAAVAAATREGWRLAPLLLPYLLILALGALVWQDRAARGLSAAVPEAWVGVHIAVSLLTYATLTVCAIAGFAAFLRERALKAKRTESGLVGLLPPLSDAESLEVRLLGISTGILALGIVTGMAVGYLEAGRMLVADHKTAFSLATLAVLVILLAARRFVGLRGRRAARLVLLAYLLLTLAYPGVKFVTDVLLA